MSGVIVAALAMGGALLLEGTSSTGGLSNAAPPAASARQVTPTTTALSTSTASPAVQGAAVTLNATVTPAAATGTVQFKDGSANIGDAVIVRNGSASQTTSTLAAGSHQLTAVFTPANPTAYGPSTSPAVPFVISGPAASSTALTTSVASPVTQGTSVALTATVTPPAAAGTVQFKDGSTNIGDAVAVSNGTASQTTSTLAIGSHQLTAVFTPTNPALFSPSTSPPVPFEVSGATATSTTLSTSSASPIVQNTPVTLNATVNPAAAAGTVQFRDGNTNIGDAVTVNNGAATTTTSTLNAGSH